MKEKEEEEKMMMMMMMMMIVMMMMMKEKEGLDLEGNLIDPVDAPPERHFHHLLA